MDLSPPVIIGTPNPEDGFVGARLMQPISFQVRDTGRGINVAASSVRIKVGDAPEEEIWNGVSGFNPDYDCIGSGFVLDPATGVWTFDAQICVDEYPPGTVVIVNGEIVDLSEAQG